MFLRGVRESARCVELGVTSVARQSWPLCVSVAAVYGKRWQSMSDARLRKMERCFKQVTLPDWWNFDPAYVLPCAMHGYMYRHREESKGFDPLKYMTPQTQFVTENFLTNFEAFCEAWEQGWRPPKEKGGRWIKKRSLKPLDPPAAGYGESQNDTADKDDTEMVPIGQVAASLSKMLREGK